MRNPPGNAQLLLSGTCGVMADSDNVFDENEAYVKLLSDDELEQASKVGHELYETIDEFLENVRPETIEKLNELIEAVEESYDKSRKARIAGTSATITGSVVAIVGFGLSFVTFGASLGVAAVGSALAAAGGVTLGGAEVGYLAVARKKTKEAEKACRKDNEAKHNIETKGREFSDHLDSLAEKHPTLSKEAIFNIMVRHTWNSGKPALRAFYDGYKLIDGASDIGRSIITVRNTVKVGVQAGARGVYFGLGTVGRVFSIASVALDVVFIPIDIAVLVKSASDVHKYKKGNSKSSAASNIRKIKKQLQDNTVELEKVRDELPGAQRSDETED